MTSPTSSSSPAGERDGAMTLGTVVLLVLSVLLYCGMLASLSGLRETDAAGRGVALAFSAMFGVALWLVLALLTTMAAVAGRMSGMARIGAAAFLPLSAIAASVAIDLFGGRGNDWVVAVPVLLPPVIAAYAIRVRPLRVGRPPTESRIMIALGAGVVLLTLAPLLVGVLDALPNSARAAREAQAESVREHQLKLEEDVALRQEAIQFARLGPNSPLAEYLPYFPGGDSRSRQALADARKVKSRQSDAVSLLEEGRINGLSDLFRLDIAVTPEICAAYGKALESETAKITAARPDYLSVAIELEQQLPNLRWLVEGGCNLNDALGVLADRMRAVPSSQRLESFATAVSDLRR